MNTKICSKCKEELPLSEFNKKKSNKDGLQRHCRKCHAENNKKHYLKNKKKYSDSAMRRKREISAYIQDYKKGKACIKCGEDHPACLHFHHRDPSTKLFNIGNARRDHALGKVKEEIKKCDLICANCHAKLHYQENIGSVV